MLFGVLSFTFAIKKSAKKLKVQHRDTSVCTAEQNKGFLSDFLSALDHIEQFPTESVTH